MGRPDFGQPPAPLAAQHLEHDAVDGLPAEQLDHGLQDEALLHDMEMGVMDESGYEGYWSCMHGSMYASRKGIGNGVYQGMYGNLSEGDVEGKWV